MIAASVRRGLLVLGLLLVVFAAVWDVLRPDSLLRRAWAELQPQRPNPAQQTLDEIQRTRGKSLRR